MTRRRKRRIKLARRWACLAATTRHIVSLTLGTLVLMGSLLSCGCTEMSPALLRHLHHHRHHQHQHQLQQHSSYGPVAVGNLCGSLPGQVARQLRLCRVMQSSQEAAEAVRNGTANGLLECRRLFQDQRWNCTHSAGDHQLLAGDFGQTLGLRESAFVQAITAAALVHSVASACSLGSLRDCACDRSRVGTIKHHEEKWKWGGCSHNIRQGMQFAKYHVELLDAVHQYQAHERRHRSLVQQARHFRHNLLPIAAPVAATQQQQHQQPVLACPPAHQNLSRASHMKLIGSLLAPDSLERHQVLRLAVNMHNNRVGRMAVANNMELKCRCHGLSGSCSMKTCWLALPDFQQVGAYLKRKYDAALHLPAAVDLNRLIPMMDRDELSSILADELRATHTTGQPAHPIRLAAGDAGPAPLDDQQLPVVGAGQWRSPLVAPHRPGAEWPAGAADEEPASASTWSQAQVVAPIGQQQYLGLLRELKLCGTPPAQPQAPVPPQPPHHIRPNNSALLVRRWDSQPAAGHYIRSANQHLAQVLAHSRNKDDLIYLHKSPDFCVAQTRLGFAGLSGRLCSRNGTAHDNCDKLCCSSGYSLRAIHYPYTCDCKFQYCCSILCKQCEETAEFHVCN